MADNEQNKNDNISEETSPEPEKRFNLRSQFLVLKVKGDDAGNVFFGYAKNISITGMFIASVNPKKTGEEFTIEFTLPKKKEPIQCKCLVEWSMNYNPKSKFEPGMGVRFLDLDEEGRTAINDCIKNSSPFV